MYLYVSLRCAHAIRQQFTHLFPPIWNNVHNRVWGGHVQQLGANLGGAWPPNSALPGTVVEEDLNQGTLTLQTVFQIQTNMKYMQYI